MPDSNPTYVHRFLFNQVQRSCQNYQLDKMKDKVTQFFDATYYEGRAGPLFNIPLVSDILEKPVNSLKESTINGGLIGNVISG